jgi:hypothetical protein
VRPIIRGGEFAFLFAWITFGLLVAVATINMWLRTRPAGAKGSNLATILSAIAALPSLAFALELGAGFIRESTSGRGFAGQAYMVIAMRYWILVGGTLLIWSFFDLPWSAGKGMLRLVRVCHVVLWGLASSLMLLGLYFDS